MRNIILFLDDDSKRAALAFQRMNEEDQKSTFWVEDVKDAIDVLINYQDVLKEVHLDHDLNGETYVHPARDDCGMEVVRKLEHMSANKFKGCKFIVHTWNEHAGPNMVKRLKKAGYDVQYKPFGV